MLATLRRPFISGFVMDAPKTTGGTPPDAPIACKIPGFYCIRAETKLQDENNKDIATIVGMDDDWDILGRTAGVCDRTKKDQQKCTKLDVSMVYDDEICNGTVTTIWKNGNKDLNFPSKLFS